VDAERLYVQPDVYGHAYDLFLHPLDGGQAALAAILGALGTHPAFGDWYVGSDHGWRLTTPKLAVEAEVLQLVAASKTIGSVANLGGNRRLAFFAIVFLQPPVSINLWTKMSEVVGAFGLRDDDDDDDAPTTPWRRVMDSFYRDLAERAHAASPLHGALIGPEVENELDWTAPLPEDRWEGTLIAMADGLHWHPATRW